MDAVEAGGEEQGVGEREVHAPEHAEFRTDVDCTLQAVFQLPAASILPFIAKASGMVIV